jgi:hypothetical protein
MANIVITDRIEIQGRNIVVELFDKDGNRKAIQYIGHNMVTPKGKKHIANQLSSAPSSVVKYMWQRNAYNDSTRQFREGSSSNILYSIGKDSDLCCYFHVIINAYHHRGLSGGTCWHRNGSLHQCYAIAINECYGCFTDNMARWCRLMRWSHGYNQINYV